MNNYDFLNLSDIEFEALTHDLLEASLEVPLERFTAGKDGGIDLRHAKGPDNLIIQCKRYKDVGPFMSSLKKEIKKVQTLSPTRLIIVTSVGLTPNRKRLIQSLFNPFILEPSDIISRQEINDLLAKYSDIERRHFKLWLPSINILEKILHSKTYNQSQFEVERIKENISLYVQNPSFEEAINILNKENFVIISGIPGIGKTTLARILVYHLLANDFEEFIFMSDNINDGYEFYEEGKKQVFLFDDFLGSNLLENKLLRNEEKKIIDFIEQIHKSKNKVLILTTREYVLNQAKNKFEPFENYDWQKAKCIVDLSKYTKPIRAQILYNHIFFSGLPQEYVDSLLNNNNFLKIIDHPNYSPRIIEGLTVREEWANISPDAFFEAFMEFLHYPERIWNHAFRNSISEVSRCILLLLATTGTPINVDDLRAAIQQFVFIHGSKRALIYSEIVFKHSLSELEDSFIKIEKDSKNNLIIDFQNPSIYDFLIIFIKNNSDYLEDILTSAIFLNQYFTVFTYKDDENKKIVIRDYLLTVCLRNIFLNFNTLRRSTLIRVVYSPNTQSHYWMKRDEDEFYKLDQILRYLPVDKSPELKNLVKNELKNLQFVSLSSDQWDHLVGILKNIDDDLEVNLEELFSYAHSNLHSLYDVENLRYLKNLFDIEYDESINEDELSRSIKEVIEMEIASAEMKENENLLERVRDIESQFDFSFPKEVAELERGVSMFENFEDDRWEYMDPSDYGISKDDLDDGNSSIIDMFDSLRNRE